MATTHEIESIQRRLQNLRGSLFHGNPAHRAASARLRRQASALLAGDPTGPHAASLGSVLELLDAQLGVGPRLRTAS